MAIVTKARAELIARAQACPRCHEYTYKRIKVREAEASDHVTGAAWLADMVCGVCAAHLQLALEPDGDVLVFS